MKALTVFRTVAILSLLILISGLGTAAENGVKLLNENFDYTVGSNLITNGNWKNFTYFTIGVPGTDPVKVVAGGLTYPGYQTTAVGNSAGLASKGNDACMSFIPQAGTIYASMLVNVKAAPTEKGDFFFSFGDLYNSSSDGFGKLHVKRTGDKLAFSVTRKDVSEAAVFTDAVYNLNETYLVVVKFTQHATDGQVELFINPALTGAEPLPLLTSKGGTNPKLLRHVILYQGRGLGNDVMVDAIRVATSWEALFDASEVVKLPYVNAPVSTFLGSYTEGSDQAVVKKVNIKAENLTEDVTVSYSSDGYITLNTKKITKEACMGINGYDLELSLKPKDGKVLSDRITFTSAGATSTMDVDWSYVIPVPELDAPDIATILSARKFVYYTLVNPVTISNVEIAKFGTKYTIKDASGSLTFTDNGILGRFPYRAGTKLTELVIDVKTAPESTTFTPEYYSRRSPNLIITAMEQNGFKTFHENFEYEVGNLAGSGEWTAYNYGNAGGDPMKTEKGGLSYPLYQNIPIGNSVALSASGEDATVKFQGVGGTVYSSFLVKVRDASQEGNFIYSFHRPKSAFTGFGFVFVKKVGDKLAFGISQSGMNGGVPKYSPADYNLNETYLLVVKYHQGPGNNDDWAELFINPNVLGMEPEDAIRADKGGAKPNGNLDMVNLYQHTGYGLGATCDVLIDAVRVATCWESLFVERGVETAPEVDAINMYGSVSTFVFGTIVQGDVPKITVMAIKGKNLRGDLSVSCKSEGYLELNSATISKEEAESETGFMLRVTLDPKDGAVLKDTILISGEFINREVIVSWIFMARGDVNTLAELKAVKNIGIYKLTNQVIVKDIRTEKGPTGEKVIYYTLEDGTGSVDVQFFKADPVAPSNLDKIVKGDYVRYLCVQANSKEDGEFAFATTDSPELEITKSGIENVSGGSVTGYADGKFIAEGADNIRLFDVNGKLLKEANGETLVMNELPAAVYIVQYTDQAGKVYMAKVMK